MHGMAGSAALLVLAVSQAPTPVQGLLYVALFGLGSMVGMGALSAAIAVPLVISARGLTAANRGLQVAVGVLTIGDRAAHDPVDAAVLSAPRRQRRETMLCGRPDCAARSPKDVR